jgi:HEAT repeat protein
VEEAFRAGGPGQEASQTALAAVLGNALTARAKTSNAGAGSFGNNPFLMAVATQTAAYEHSPRTRQNLARLLGYLPHESAVEWLAKALADPDAREMARQALDCHPSPRAAQALLEALDAQGNAFRVGVVNSLAKRKGPAVAAALRKAAADPQPEVRQAAWDALAGIPDPAHDTILEKASQAGSVEDRRAAEVARVRLAWTLRAAGNRPACDRIAKAILDSPASAPQKASARLALGV